MKPRSAASRRHLSSSPFNARPVPAPLEKFEVRDRVSHDTYGLGRVVAVESETTVLVDFAAGQKRISAPFTKLVKL